MTQVEPPSDESSGVWMTLTELAEARGVGKSAISERLARLKAEGRVTTKPGKGRAVLINVVEFDVAVGQVTDLAREQGQATRRGDDVDDEATSNRTVYTREQARRAGYDAELARLNLEERLGELVKVAELRPVIEAAVSATVTAIDSLTHSAEALRSAAQDDDAARFDRALRDETHRIRTAAAVGLRKALKGADTV